MQVLQKWGEYAQDVQFILQRSALDKANSTAPLSPPAPRAKLGLGPGQGPGGQKSASAEPPAVWKPPPPAASYPGSGPVSNPGPGVPGAKNGVGARLSPDSGRGSDRTGSDSSNSYPDHHSRLASQVNGFHNNIPKSSSASQVILLQLIYSEHVANLNKSVWLVKNTTTASKYIPKRTRICIN